MPWIGAAIGAVGGLLSANAAKKAGNTQADAGRAAADAQQQATRETNQLQADMYRQGMVNQSPWLQGGQTALAALMSGTGLGGVRASQSPGAFGQNASQVPIGNQGGVQGTNVFGNQPVAAGSFVNAEGVAVDAQGNPIQTGVNYGIGNVNYGATQEELDQGAASVRPGQFTETFKGEDIYLDPSYKFRLEEGQRAMRAAQAAGGNRFSGQSMKDIVNYGQGAASQEFGAANARFLQNQGLLFDRLSGLAGIGQNAANTATSAGQAAANAIGQNTQAGMQQMNDYRTSGANAQAHANVGATNALVGGAQRGMSDYIRMSYLNPSTNSSWAKSNTGLYNINPNGDQN